ncbi:MAG: cupredoxin domain-containing protein [Rhodospirillales bacterium]
MTSETGPSPSPEHRPPGRVMKLVVVAAALLVVAGGIAFYVASQTARRGAPEQAEALTVTITGRTCEPNVLTVPAGRNTFRIVNKSDRAVEWEILDGVMVVEERENIAPGFTQTLTAKLAPGHYAITCGLLSNPRGTLTVTPSAGSEAEIAGGPPPVAFIGPLAEYQVYLMLQSAELAEASRPLRRGDQGGRSR